VVDRVDSGGTEKDAALREYITFANVSGSTVTTLTRGLGGTTDQDHAVGAVVEFVMDVVQEQALIDTLIVEHGTDGTHNQSLVVTPTGTQTLTNKTLTSPTINTPKINEAVALTSSSTELNLLDGVTALVTATSTNTFTNKRITPRVVTATDDASAVIDLDVTDQYQLTAVANATTFTITGSPTNGQKLIIRLKDAGVGKGLTWDAAFNAVGVTLPTTTVAGKTHYIGGVYNTASSQIDVLAVAVEP
jgi:hypothetical protein